MYIGVNAVNNWLDKIKGQADYESVCGNSFTDVSPHTLTFLLTDVAIKGFSVSQSIKNGYWHVTITGDGKVYEANHSHFFGAYFCAYAAWYKVEG